MAISSVGRSGAGRNRPTAAAKPPELEDPLNRHFFHPLARRLSRWLQPTGISPNVVSAISGLVVAAAAIAYAGLGWPISVLAGFALHLSWHIFDGADGELARLTGRVSPAGELIDGIADYVSHLFLYTVLAIFLLAPSLGSWAYLIALLAGLSRIAQSNHAESQRRTYLWRVYGVPWLKQAQASGDELFERKGLVAAISVACVRGYIKLAGATSPQSDEIDAALEAASGDAREEKRLKRLCRHSSRTAIVLQHALGANPRTIALGISMTAGSPIYFFITEISLLNLILVISILHQRRGNRSLAARLAAPRPPPGRG